MVDRKSRARVERILSRDFRPGDLKDLFLYLRDNCQGREVVRDLGHFAAHHYERDKGLVTQTTRDWFTIARFHFSREDLTVPYKGNKLPNVTKDFFKVCVNRLEDNYLREKSGLNKKTAYKMMQDLAERLIANSDTIWALPDGLKSTEIDLINAAISMIEVVPAFSTEELYSQFVASLRLNDLITKDEIARYKHHIRVILPLYAIASMQNCLVEVEDNVFTLLKWYPDEKNNTIHILASVPIEYSGGRTVRITTSMFEADLDPVRYCHPYLWIDPDAELELGRDRRLHPLVSTLTSRQKWFARYLDLREKLARAVSGAIRFLRHFFKV
jgi:hypothetical protein